MNNTADKNSKKVFDKNRGKKNFVPKWKKKKNLKLEDKNDNLELDKKVLESDMVNNLESDEAVVDTQETVAPIEFLIDDEMMREDFAREAKNTSNSMDNVDSNEPIIVSSNRVDEESQNNNDNVDEESQDNDDAVDIDLNKEWDKVYKNFDPNKEESQNASIDEDSRSIFSAHYNYIARICTLVFLILLFLVLCILFAFKGVNYQLGGTTVYSEYTNTDYSVCTSIDSDDNCLSKGLEYVSSVVNDINLDFSYEAIYSRKYTFNSNYYVVGELSIFDSKDKKKIRYKNEDLLVDESKLNISGEIISFSADTEIDFKHYKELASQYINDFGFSGYAELDIGLYLKDADVSRKISSVKIPLTEEAFVISTEDLDNQNQILVSNLKHKKIDSFYIFISVVCLLMDILLFVYLFNFIYMVKHLDNAYNSKLKSILKEYDDIIVNAINDYIIPDNVRVVMVESFEELLDARNSLDKPIVYERINNIKSKFYVEDSMTIYIYTMKDNGD